jgi:hypothetical protein
MRPVGPSVGPHQRLLSDEFGCKSKKIAEDTPKIKIDEARGSYRIIKQSFSHYILFLY